MSENNPYVQIGDNFDAESYNGAIALIAAFKPLFTINLPADLDGGIFVIGSVDSEENLVYTKAAFMVTFLTLVNTQITSGTIQLLPGQSTGTATFRKYPNIQPLKTWKNISWVAGSTGAVNCTINRVSDGSVIDANISNPQDLTDESMGLEWIDFIFTLSGSNPVLENISLQLQGGM